MPLTINAESIPDELLEEEFQAIKSHYERMGAMSCCERDSEFRGYARDNVIARVLLNQAAEKEFPVIAEAEISAALDRVVTEHGGIEEVCQKLGVESINDPGLIQDIKSSVRMDKIFARIWGDEVAPTEAELREFMGKHQQDYLSEERVRAVAIFKKVEKVEDRGKIYDVLRGLRKRALEGEDFETMAIENTDKEDKSVDLGWFKRGEFMDEFDLIFFSLTEGEVSPVFASHWGFHLAKIVGREPAEPLPFEQVRSQLEERLNSERRQEKTRTFLAEIKERSVIEGLED